MAGRGDSWICARAGVYSIYDPWYREKRWRRDKKEESRTRYEGNAREVVVVGGGTNKGSLCFACCLSIGLLVIRPLPGLFALVITTTDKSNGLSLETLKNSRW
jgi:hypothetical protein